MCNLYGTPDKRRYFYHLDRNKYYYLYNRLISASWRLEAVFITPRPSVLGMRRKARSSLVQIVACRLLSAKSLFEQQKKKHIYPFWMVGLHLTNKPDNYSIPCTRASNILLFLTVKVLF